MQISLRSIKTFSAVGAPLMIALTSSYAETPQIERVDIFDAGIYCTNSPSRSPEPNAVSGYLSTVDNIALLKRTPQVPLQVGTKFGARYKIVGTPIGEIVELRLIMKPPFPGLREPNTGKTTVVSDYTTPRRIGKTGFHGAYLEYDWWLLPGVWVFEYWDKNRKLAEQAFELIKPQSARERNLENTSCSPVARAITVPTMTDSSNIGLSPLGAKVAQFEIF